MMTLLLPLLIILQFAAAFAAHDEATAGLQWNVVFFSIALFTVAIFLFQKTLHDMEVTISIVHLIPELVTVIIVALIFFRLLTEAFLVMLAGMLFMALAVALSSAYLLMMEKDDMIDAPSKEPCDDVKIMVV